MRKNLNADHKANKIMALGVIITVGVLVAAIAVSEFLRRTNSL